MKRRQFLAAIWGFPFVLRAAPQAGQSRPQPEPYSQTMRRLNPSFYGVPYVEDLDKVEADAVFVGIPFDLGTTARPGARYGPSGLRAASPRFGGPFDPQRGWYDYELEEWILRGVRLADVGDINIMPADFMPNFDRITEVIGKILARGALPAVLGGDHSITFPVLRAYRGTSQKIRVIHFDSHLDFTDGRQHVRYAHGNPMRRSFELPWVSGLTSVGIRGLSRTTQALEEGRERGVQVLTAWKVLQMGPRPAVASIPEADGYYVSFDIDVIDPSLSPATGTPVPGGFTYYQAKELLAEIARKGKVVGFDFVELAPSYDFDETSTRLTGRLILDFLGAIFKYEKARQGK